MDIFEKLLEKLKELFQLNQPELDFGIYRIMHAKSDEITKFLEQDLLPQVKDALSGYQSVDRVRVERELGEAISQAKSLGVDPNSVEKVKTLRAQLDDGPNPEVIEAEVYEALYKFFRRYYTQGDFLSRRVYKKDVYAIPYDGEEVALHWANKDQYYIKSSETLRDYAFRLRPEDAANPMRVHFRVVGADEEEHNTVKTAEGKQRVFILAPNRTPEVVDSELHIYFQYEQSDKKQNDLNAKTTDWVKASTGKNLTEWKTELLRLAPIKSNESRTLLEKHLEQYTARNTFDYFIHKDLGGYLRRELDFFIKNEIMHLDDIEDATAERADQYLAKIKAVKNIAVKIITFLAELENFQKKLWLKKKFVVNSRYLISFNLLPKSVQGEVLKSSPQLLHWQEIMGAHGIDANDIVLQWPSVLVDTSLLTGNLSEQAISSLKELDDLLIGRAIHSDNRPALSIISKRFNAQLDATYIDPPYNTGEDDFPYKDGYKSSSWLAMMSETLFQIRSLLSEEGHLICHIDEHEHSRLDLLLDKIFGQQNNLGPVIWDKRNPKGDARGIATQHEYISWAVKDASYLSRDGDSIERTKENAQRILDKANDLVKKARGVNDGVRATFKEWIKSQNLSGGEAAYNMIDDDGKVYRSVSMAWPNKKKAPPEYFRPLIHPSTGEACPVPQRGWRNPPETMDALISKEQVLFGADESTQPTRKYLLEEHMTENVPSILYFGGSDDSLQANIGYAFPNPKPIRIAQSLIESSTSANGVVLDCFAGSGTTAHAVIELNEISSLRRRFVVVDQSTYFNSVLIQRIERVIAAKRWASGVPEVMIDNEDLLRRSGVFQVFALEQYEDTLNNLEVKRPTGIEGLFSSDESALREEYVLRYMLDVETRESASLLNMSAFSDPRKYTLRVKSPGTDETVERNVDLLETFNWLLGIRVQHVAASGTYSAEFSNKDKRTVAKLKSSETGSYWFRQVTGTLPDGREALIVWRTLSDDASHDEAALLAWFESKGHLASESLDVIYINGDCNLGASKPPSARWSVESLEAHFHELMFEGSES